MITQSERYKHVDIKFIPMNSLKPAKKLVTEPENTRKLDKNQKSIAEKIFLHTNAKKNTEKSIDGNMFGKVLEGK